MISSKDGIDKPQLVEETQIEDEEEASAPTHQDPYVAMTLAGLRAK